MSAYASQLLIAAERSPGGAVAAPPAAQKGIPVGACGGGHAWAIPADSFGAARRTGLHWPVPV